MFSLLLGILTAGGLTAVLLWPAAEGLGRAPAPELPAEKKARLLNEMANVEPALRRHAFDALVRLGPLTRDDTCDLLFDHDPEVVRLGFELHAACQRKYGVPPTRCNGVELLPEGDTVWTRDPAEEKAPVRLGLRLKNVSDKPILFSVNRCCLVYLTYPARNRHVTGHGYTDGQPKPFPPVLLGPGESHRIAFDGELAFSLSGDGAYCLRPAASAEHHWGHFDDLRPGGYFIIFYIKHEPELRKTDPRGWAGSARSEPLAITIR